ncbi:amino acid adenylation domain-containing protein [Streptomyces sp. NPDC050610]|uniref:amino acid adenylation domain-containing protein n=1 Tax=Streptomyces sp. NPDC050610 TaxID=3157097 RepID=UPI003449C24F
MTGTEPWTPPAAWNDTATDYRRDATLVDLVREAARSHPGRPALLDADGTTWTHAELGDHSDRLAALLRQRGLGRGDVVALYADRTPHAVASLLAVVKSGAAYVPLDPAWPAARAVRLLRDLRVRCVVTDAAHLRTVQELRWSVPSVTDVVCPDIEVGRTWEAVLDRPLVEEFFDFLSGEPDPLEAAGFNLRRSERPYTPDDVAAYADHVAALGREAGGTAADVLEVGCGSGLIMEALAPRAKRWVAVDPSDVAVRRNVDTAAALGLTIEGQAAYAHEVADTVRGPFDLVVMASTVQFLPDMDYLLETLGSLTGLLRPGGRLLLCDLIDPQVESHAGLRVPPILLERLPEFLPAVGEVDVRRRHSDRFAGELAHRYDAFIEVADPGRASRVGGRVWTAADLPPSAPQHGQGDVTADDLAYAIFTSGSTGKPKAVAVQHRQAVNLIEWFNRTHDIVPDDRMLFVTSFCFDLSVYDIFGVLAAGASVRIASRADVAEPESLIDALTTEPVTLWDSAPAALSMLVPFLADRGPQGRDHLRLVALSGDWIPLTLPGEIRTAFPRVRVMALGGATECTVWSNRFPVEDVDPDWPSIPYGRPMANARYYVLDEDIQPCPPGTPGDLYVAGDCVALGYLGDAALTADKFLPDPWAPGPAERMYRTGDRAQWLDDGTVRFLGRLDDQVKLRGYRVELGEVRSALAGCPGVRAAAVAAVEAHGGKTLAAYYVPAVERPPVAAEVRAHLAGVLPAHMVPARISAVDAFPLTPTGKVDLTELAAWAG